ncbi:MAG: c-type cytochrome [Candidatus Kapaibacteriota bacterium]
MNIKKIVKSVVVLGSLTFAFTAGEAVTGKDIFLNNKCNQCHSISSQGIESKVPGGKYPDLSDVGNMKLEKEFLKKFLMKEESIDSKKHAIKFKGDDAELTTLVEWLQTLKKQE